MLFELYPAFNFSKAYKDIAWKACWHYDSVENRYIHGEGYSWAHFTEEFSGSMPWPLLDSYHLPSTASSIAFIMLDAAIFICLAWYCDKVVSSNRGKPDVWYFPFSPTY